MVFLTSCCQIEKVFDLNVFRIFLKKTHLLIRKFYDFDTSKKGMHCTIVEICLVETFNLNFEAPMNCMHRFLRSIL